MFVGVVLVCGTVDVGVNASSCRLVQHVHNHRLYVYAADDILMFDQFVCLQ